MRTLIQQYFEQLQQHICTALTQTDGKGIFQEDAWKHHSGGGGLSKVMMNGDIIEKGGVNFSATEGVLTSKMAERMNVPVQAYFATGVSIVIHAHNPFVPTIHKNVRYFELADGKYWFGGGIDLTPMYVMDVDAIRFHQGLKKLCDNHDITYYPKFKSWADEYFYIPHREEMRGVGGIFFDYLAEDEQHSKTQLFEFVQSVGNYFAPFYTETMVLRKDTPYTEAHKDFQLWRRGRYVEFNLVYDRGTLFGLEQKGRTESILMSLPYEVRWIYQYAIAEGTPEAYTLSCLQPKDWLALTQS